MRKLDEKKLDEASLEAGFKALHRPKPRKSRHLIEVFAEMLEAAGTYGGDVSYTRLLNYCGLTGNLRMSIIEKLAAKGLIRIEKRNRDRVIIVSEKGHEWLRKAQEVLATVT